MLPPPPAGQQSNLPIIQKATEAYKLWHGFHNKFPRLSKFSLGAKIEMIIADMMENLFLARYATGDRKSSYVNSAGVKLDLLKFFLQVAWELNAINSKNYALLLVPLNDIGKMIGGWQKQLQTKQ